MSTTNHEGFPAQPGAAPEPEDLGEAVEFEEKPKRKPRKTAAKKDEKD